jgi:hypothetical protein
MMVRSILLLIDVEPDPRKTRGNAGEWVGSQRALLYLEAFRCQIEKKARRQAFFNWFIRADPQIEKSWGRADWIGKACPELVKTIKEHRDACGIHPHLWRWDARRCEWFNDFNNPDWTAECLYTSIEGFSRLFDRSPDLCRFGDRWLNQDAVELMRVSGIQYDFTIEPGLLRQPVYDDSRATGWLPDYRNAPREPYRPSRENFLLPESSEANDKSLWMVPLTTTAPVWELIRRPPYLIRASRSPNLSLPSSYVWPHLRSQLSVNTTHPLVIVVRTGDLAQLSCVQNFLRTTEEFVKTSRITDCEFAQPYNVIAKYASASLRQAPVVHPTRGA